MQTFVGGRERVVYQNRLRLGRSGRAAAMRLGRVGVMADLGIACE